MPKATAEEWEGEMIGLVALGTSLRITDPVSGDCGTIGVVDRVENLKLRLRLPDGRVIWRSWGMEVVK